MKDSSISIEEFLQSICRFISTEEKARDIRDEFEDHIESHKEYYMEQGFDEKIATKKALNQMGDPKILGKSYQDKIKNGRIGSAAIIGACTLLVSLNGIYDILQKPKMAFIIIPYLILIVSLYGMCIITILKANRDFKELKNKEPLFIIQSYKQKNWEEHFLAGIKIFIVVPIILLIVVTALDSSTTKNLHEWMDVGKTSAYCIMVYVILYSERKNQAIVYKEGILTFYGFIPWCEIYKYRWNTERRKDKVYHQLQLKCKVTRRQKWLGLSRANIKVSYYQTNLIESMLEQNDICYSTYM